MLPSAGMERLVVVEVEVQRSARLSQRSRLLRRRRWRLALPGWARLPTEEEGEEEPMTLPVLEVGEARTLAGEAEAQGAKTARLMMEEEEPGSLVVVVQTRAQTVFARQEVEVVSFQLEAVQASARRLTQGEGRPFSSDLPWMDVQARRGRHVLVPRGQHRPAV